MSHNKERWVFLVSPFPPPYGGIASYSENLFNRLIDNEGFNVVKYNTSRFEKYRFGKSSKDRNYLRILKPTNLFFAFLCFFDYFYFYFKLITKRNVIVHVHTCSFWGWWRSTLFIILARLAWCKSILHIHNAFDKFYFEESSHITKFFIRLSLRFPNILVTLSDQIKKIVMQLTTNSVFSIYNGIDVNVYKHEKKYEKPLRALFAGHVGQHKGVKDILEALSKAKIKVQDFIITFVGDGEIEEMRKIAFNLNISNQVNFMGMINEEDKIKHFKESHIFLLPSYGEGQPISILEAMASGMVVISSKVGSIPEIITEGVNGFLINPGDIAKLSMVLKQVQNIELIQKIGSTNRSLAELKYDFSRVLEDNLMIYNKLI